MRSTIAGRAPATTSGTFVLTCAPVGAPTVTPRAAAAIARCRVVAYVMAGIVCRGRSCRSRRRRMTAATTHVDVLIVGAGLAGLSCAFELSTRGYRVLVLEA